MRERRALDEKQEPEQRAKDTGTLIT